MGREFELKFQADSQIIEEIHNKYGEFTTIRMKTSYYDTPGKDLRPKRWTLRRRMENGVSVCTLKTPLADGSRGEWEVEADSIEAGILALCKLDVPAGLAELAQAGLEEVCTARFTRLAKTLTLADATVELALDEGALLGGGQVLPFAEVEVELKDGSEEAALAFAAALAREFGLVPERKSKQQRALALIR